MNGYTGSGVIDNDGVGASHGGIVIVYSVCDGWLATLVV